MSLKTCEFFGQTNIVGCEADAGIGGVGHAEEFAIAGVEAVVVGHDDFFLVVDSDADDVAERESCVGHVCFGETQHGGTELVVGCDLAFQHRRVVGGFII